MQISGLILLSSVQGARIFDPVNSTIHSRFDYLKHDSAISKRSQFNYPIEGDFELDYISVFPRLDYPENGRVFNPGIQYHKGHLLTILRFNKLEKELGTVYMKNRKYHVKNNSLIGSVIFSNMKMRRPLVHLKPFHDSFTQSTTYDCESDPDWRDGGHGQQDARIFEFLGKLFMIFNARLQVKLPGTICPENEIQRGLYISELKLDDSTGLIIGWKKPVKLKTEKSLNPKNLAERNWSPFVSNGQLYVSYGLDPHVVLRVDLETGYCEDFMEAKSLSLRIIRPILEDIAFRLQTKLPENSHVLTHPLTRKLITVSPHGGTPIVRVPGRDYMLGILHIHYPGENENRIYVNYPFRMNPHKPFEIMEIGKALPLNSTRPEKYENLSLNGPHYFKDNYPADAEIAFASDITVWEKEIGDVRVAVSYGAGDAVPRVFFISLDQLESRYFSG